MSEFNDLLNIIGSDKEPIQEAQISDQQNLETAPVQLGVNEHRSPFSIQLFADEIRNHSEGKGRAYAELAQNISGYDIAHNCISNVVKKILKYPVKSFAQQWLPVILRSTVGSGIHDFVQQHSDQFTELEPSIKIPSIRFSGRIDGLIGNNVLVEIKSCTFDDYRKIVKSQRPRTPDFYQMMTYKYILENYLTEAKQQPLKSKSNPEGTRTPPPALDKYDIDTLQIIYVAHNILSDDIEDLGQALENIKHIKQVLKSKHDQFYFMTSIVLNTKDFDTVPYLDFIHRKIERINWYVNSNKLPTCDDEFVDTKKCFFCLYKDNCELI